MTKNYLFFLFFASTFLLACSGDDPDEVIIDDPIVLEDNYVPDPNFKVVGYLPTYRMSVVDQIDFSKTNYVILAFANLDAGGMLEMSNQTPIRSLVSSLKSQGNKVLLSIGGGGLSSQQEATWAKHMGSSYRKQTIEGILSFMAYNQLDGVDIDFEGDLLRDHASAYTAFVKELKAYLHDKGLAITAAVYPRNWNPSIPKQLFQEFDFINVMTYNATGLWDISNPGPHSSVEFTMNSMDYWTNEMGIANDKVIMGMPFYGHNFDPAVAKSVTYKSIVDQDPSFAYTDQMNMTYYNGIPTIVEKTALALEEVNGVMFWELGQDRFDDLSLLQASREVVDLNACIDGGELKTYFRDKDGDGLGDQMHPIQACEPPAGYVLNRDDTNDDEIAV